MILLAVVAGDNAVQGGIAVAVIGFASAIVKYMVGLLDKERARGDRLEISMLDKILPVLSTASTAMAGMTDVMKQVQTERQAEREAALRKGRDQ